MHVVALPLMIILPAFAFQNPFTHVGSILLQPPCHALLLQELFEDPVVAADGHTYERASIEDWLFK